MAISHKDIPDAELHNPKGFENAGNNQVLKTDGSRNLVWQQVDTNDIANNAVTTAKILNGEVTTNKLGIGAVTTSRLGTNSVTASKINNEEITFDKLDFSIVSGNTIILQSNGEDESTGPSWVNVSSFNVGWNSGTVKVTYQLRDVSSGATSSARVRIGGTVYDEISTSSSSWLSGEVVVPVNAGEIINIEQRNSGAAGRVRTRNRRILVANPGNVWWLTNSFGGGSSPFTRV